MVLVTAFKLLVGSVLALTGAANAPMQQPDGGAQFFVADVTEPHYCADAGVVGVDKCCS